MSLIFGVPGEENADFMMALSQSKSIRFILTRHEQGAAFMAEVYGRLTGNPAGCLATLGPGATNLITGVADSNMDRAPMLVLTGQGSTDRLHKESHQIMDVVSMFKPVTKWAATILNPDTIPEIVRKAVRVSRTEKPGAVLIEIPEDIAKQETSQTPMIPKRFTRSVPDVSVLDEAVELIQKAKQPIMIAGNGCIRKRASKQLRRFAELTGIGVVNTFMAKGSVDYEKKYCLFTIGLGAKDRVMKVLDESDLILTLGFDMVEYPPDLWNSERKHKIIHADFLPAEIDSHYHPDIELVGDLAYSLSELTNRLSVLPPLTFCRNAQEICRKEMIGDFEEHKDDDSVGKIRPQKVLWEVRQSMGPSDILLSDVGAHKMWIARHYQCHEPNTCLISNGFCSMGFSLPGAISASLVLKDKRILGIAGDAGFMMNVQEMETARRLNCNIVMMVWEDKSYGLIEWKQSESFGHHTDLSFGNPDWIQLAESFGWQGLVVTQASDLSFNLELAFNTEGPSLLVLPIDYSENQILSRKLEKIASG